MCFVAYKTTKRKHRFNDVFFQRANINAPCPIFCCNVQHQKKKLMQRLKEDHLSSSNSFKCRIYSITVNGCILAFAALKSTWHDGILIVILSPFLILLILFQKNLKHQASTKLKMKIQYI